MKKNFETGLPENYREALVIDAASKKFAVIMNLLALALTVVGVAAALLIIRPFSQHGSFSMISYIVFVAVMLLYIVLHEIVHGIAYKLLTGHKLTFGFKGTVAYCGVPDIFVYRTAALVALLAPFMVFNIVFLTAACLLTKPFDSFLAAAMLAIHIGGCAGDLYDTWIYLFRFRSGDTLMRDTGPKQTFYVKEEKAHE